MSNVVDRSKVKNYFKAKSTTLSIILMIVGVFFILMPNVFIKIIGLAMAIGGGYLFYKAKNNFDNEDKVDEMMKIEIEEAKQRGIKKFNLVQEQVSLIEPISIHGPAAQPNSPTATVLSYGTKGMSRTFQKKLAMNNDDPIFIGKIGSDSKYRYTLLSITTYLFGEEQLYIYYSNVDITTGLVFSEGTHEYFYKDIEAMSTSQSNTREYNIRKKQFERIVKECFLVSTSGSSYLGAFEPRKMDEPSKLEEQFTAMRNLIREKKKQ